MTVDVRWATLTAASAGLLALLSDLERRRVDSLSRPADQARSLLAAALLRVAVSEHLGCAPGEVVVDRTCPECGHPHGAPRIVGTGPPAAGGRPLADTAARSGDPGGGAPHASVSHSGLLVLVAVNPQGPVGVDVQRIADLPDPAGAVSWARREALLKARSAAGGPGRAAIGRQAGEQDASGAGPVAPPVAVRNIDAPLAGYAAALAADPGQVTDLLVRQWAGPGTGRGRATDRTTSSTRTASEPGGGHGDGRHG